MTTVRLRGGARRPGRGRGVWVWLGLAVVALLGPGGCQGPPKPKQQAKYVGPQVCKECHPTSWKKWIGQRHSRTTVVLQTRLAQDIATREGQEPCCLPDDRTCLGCHGTGVVDGRIMPHEEGFHPEEGVTCEACHGPASIHVAAARAHTQRPGLVSSLLHPPKDCKTCHAPRESHERSRMHRFDEAKFRKMIDHGVEDPPVVDWLKKF